MTDTTDTHATPSAPAGNPHMIELRTHLMATLASLRDRTNPMEPDRARAVAQVASVLIDSAKVEVDYLKATGQHHSPFLEEPADPAVAHLGNAPGGWTAGRIEQRANGVTRHTMGG